MPKSLMHVYVLLLLIASGVSSINGMEKSEQKVEYRYHKPHLGDSQNAQDMAVQCFYDAVLYAICSENIADIRSLFSAQPDQDFRRRALLYTGPNGTLLHVAARNPSPSFVRELFMYEGAIAINARHLRDGGSPLIEAINAHHWAPKLEVPDLLITAKADVSIAVNNGFGKHEKAVDRARYFHKHLGEKFSKRPLELLIKKLEEKEKAQD